MALSEFQRELAQLINRYSLENGSATPDFILAEYLKNCLVAFDSALVLREQWYGRGLTRPAQLPPPIGPSDLRQEASC